MAIKTRRFIANRKSCSCSMPGVWRAVSYCKGSIVIFHSPRACSHIARGMDINMHYRVMADESVEEWEPAPLLSSQLEEEHSIFGGGERLMQCIAYSVREYRPKLIVIASSCVAGVIGDDVVAAAEEAEQLYHIPVIASESCGFLDGEYYQGYFEIAGKIIDRFFKRQPHESGTVVLLGESGGPWGSYAKEVTRLLRAMNLKVLGQFPGYWPVERFADVTRAEGMVILGGRGLMQTGLTRMAQRLSKSFDMKYLPADIYPVGLSNTMAWLQGIGKIMNREKEAATVIEREMLFLEKKLETFRMVTRGRKIVLCLGRQLQYFNPAAVLEMIHNLQVDLTGIILLDAYSGTEKENMLKTLAQYTDTAIFSAAEGEMLLQQAELILTTHELKDRNLRQLFVPALLHAGIAGEIEFMEAVYRLLKSKIRKGGISYV